MAALVCYVACAGTDAVDGVVARRRGETTRLGLMLDPVADIASTAAVYAAFLANGWIAGWVYGVLVARYAMFFGGIALLRLTIGPFPLAATAAGKIVGVLQALVAILILVLAADDPGRIASVRTLTDPFLGLIFAAVIVSQLVMGIRHAVARTQNASA